MIYSGFTEDCETEQYNEIHPDIIADFEPMSKAPDWITEAHHHILNKVL